MMTEKESALYSHYIIDGIRLDMTPAELLDECMGDEGYPSDSGFPDIIDESTEPSLSSFVYDIEKEREYISKTVAASNMERPFKMQYPEHFTRLQIAKGLLYRLWSKGHFKLGDLRIWAQWEWNTGVLGNMAAFYRSAESAGEYIYGLGANLEDYLFIENEGESSIKFYSWLDERFERGCNTDASDIFTPQEVLFKSSPYESSHPWISEERACPATLEPEESSWLIYIPFDTCAYRLGGSLLTEIEGHDGGTAPEIADPDYFIDCYEVVRELTEDGIIMSGVTVSDGGLATAAERMCGEYGMDIDITGLISSNPANDRAKVLFGETPGVLIQVSDENYDYVDSQFLLQDIAYYPIGHPAAGHRGIRIQEASRSGVADILACLLTHTSEGED